MTSGGKRYPEKADRGTDRTGGCPRDLIARVSLMPTSAANATVPWGVRPAAQGPPGQIRGPDTGPISRAPIGAPRGGVSPYWVLEKMRGHRLATGAGEVENV